MSWFIKANQEADTAGIPLIAPTQCHARNLLHNFHQSANGMGPHLCIECGATKPGTEEAKKDPSTEPTE